MPQVNTIILYIFGGLPASGKSEMARLLARKTNSVYLRVDTIEQAIRDVRGSLKYDEGYQAAFSVASENLRNGLSVVADSVNSTTKSRQAWKEIALSSDAKHIQIEISCSDQSEHRNRIENRASNIPNLKLPTWSDVCDRHYDSWLDADIRIDTAHERPDQSFKKLLTSLEAF